MRPAGALFIPGLAAVLAPALLLGACAADVSRGSELEAVRLKLQPEVRFESGDDPGESAPEVRDLTVGPDGRIYTLHPRQALVRVHDAQGRLLGKFGGRGEAPGEFKIPVRMGLLGDRLWVLDQRANRFSSFDLEGRLLDTKPVPVQAGRAPAESPLRPDGILPDGSLSARPPVWSRDVAAGKTTEQAVLRMNDGGEVLGTLARYSLVNTVHEVGDPEDPQGFRSYRRQPFADADLVRISSYEPVLVRVERTAATGRGRARFRVTKRAFGGETIFSREYGYSPRPLEAALVDSLAREIGEQASRVHFAGAPTTAQATRWARSAMYVPAFHPPVSEVVVGRDGTVWLRREMGAGDVVDWAVLAPDGQPLGTFAAPKRLSVLAAEAGTLWGMETDERGVPNIVRYAVKPAAGRRE